MAKVVLIGRGYASGIERCVRPAAGEQAIVLVGRYLHEHGCKVDEIIAAVQQAAAPPSADAMRSIVTQHGRLTALLGTMPQCTRAPRSFASKYLHFHHPAVPIFDSYAATQVTGAVAWPGRNLPFGRPDGSDHEYWEFSVRLYCLQPKCQEKGLDPSLKELDAWLWKLGRRSASTRAHESQDTLGA